MKVGKKQKSSSSLKRLHSALKDMMCATINMKTTSEQEKGIVPENIISKNNSQPKQTIKGNVNPTKESKSLQTDNNGIVYIMSKEQRLIPKLTDEQIMEKHKQADQNMKKIWSHIISKYESSNDDGDVIDLQTGEVLEDNGHLRGLSMNKDRGNVRNYYTSTIVDSIMANEEQKNMTYDVWQDGEAGSEEEDSDYVQQTSGDDELSENDSETPEYIKNVN